MKTAKTLAGLKLPEGWRELPVDSGEWREAVDQAGCVWITYLYKQWRWCLSVPYFILENQPLVERDGQPPLKCRITEKGTIILPDGRKVRKGHWQL